ncbi:hypothetical protein TNCV_4286291 [Trichonephila clavipes]|nr:hypothetical protein TNCV_4286291 [Trichonephila clavipes]
MPPTTDYDEQSTEAGNHCTPTAAGKETAAYLQENHPRLKRYNHKNIFTIPFLMEEIEAAIAKMNPGKAPGPDVIFGRMVQHFGNLAKKELLKFLTFHGLLQIAQNLETFHRHSNFETKNKNASQSKKTIGHFPHQHPLQAHGTDYPP